MAGSQPSPLDNWISNGYFVCNVTRHARNISQGVLDTCFTLQTDMKSKMTTWPEIDLDILNF